MVAVLEIVKKLSYSAVEILEIVICVGHCRYGCDCKQSGNDYQDNSHPGQISGAVVGVGTSAAANRAVILAETAAEEEGSSQQHKN